MPGPGFYIPDPFPISAPGVENLVNLILVNMSNVSEKKTKISAAIETVKLRLNLAQEAARLAQLECEIYRTQLGDLEKIRDSKELE